MGYGGPQGLGMHLEDEVTSMHVARSAVGEDTVGDLHCSSSFRDDDGSAYVTGSLIVPTTFPHPIWFSAFFMAVSPMATSVPSSFDRSSGSSRIGSHGTTRKGEPVAIASCLKIELTIVSAGLKAAVNALAVCIDTT